MPKYVYHYFDIRGRGEPGRMLFAMAGIPFQDERIPQADWPKHKAKTPAGSLPYLEIDGTVLTQSLIIFRHLSRMFGLDGDSILDKSKVDEITAYLAEGLANVLKCYLGPQDEESQKTLNAQFVDTVNKSCKRIDEIISTNKSLDGWAVGKKLTFADIFIFEAFEVVLQGQPNILDKFPRIQSIRRKVETHSTMQKYLTQRKQTPF
ncbi:glutathione S-transferase-like [Saccostrea echinata]|uniref:glutathione S-transferase-like n=1 Tax=Saccostrea echinata TaxID=191078 RepID=UPI002A823811|nr:glutathione S-transferase-like [Saccostrea echinata]